MEDETPLQDERPLKDAREPLRDRDSHSQDDVPASDASGKTSVDQSKVTEERPPQDAATALTNDPESETDETVVSDRDKRPGAKDETVAGGFKPVEATMAGERPLITEPAREHEDSPPGRRSDHGDPVSAGESVRDHKTASPVEDRRQPDGGVGQRALSQNQTRIVLAWPVLPSLSCSSWSACSCPRSLWATG